MPVRGLCSGMTLHNPRTGILWERDWDIGVSLRSDADKGNAPFYNKDTTTDDEPNIFLVNSNKNLLLFYYFYGIYFEKVIGL
jgi:hypothetical protein